MASFLDGELVRRARVELGLTQEQAAARLGIDVRSYRRYESGAVNDAERGFVVRHPSRRRVVDRLCAELGIDEAELLSATSRPAAPAIAPGGDREPAPWPARRVHPLPPARHFVGREALLAELGAWVVEEAPRDRVVAIVAVGGAGKTSLLERLVQGPRAGGLLVWSFYEDRRVDAFLAEAAQTFATPSGEARAATVERVQEALASGPAHLLALDGLEVLQADGQGARARGELDDPALRRLLRAHAGGLGGARALVTTRFPLVDLTAWDGRGARTVRLPDLAPREAADLLGRWGVAAERGATERVAEQLGGHALSLAMAGSYAAAFLGGDAARLAEVDLESAASDDPLARRLSRVLAAYARALDPRERDLMARLAVFPSGATQDALLAIARAGGAVAGELAGACAADVARALARLERLGLVAPGRALEDDAPVDEDGDGDERAGPAWLVHPFVRESFARLLDLPAEEVHAVDRVRLARASLVGRPDAHGGGDLDRAEGLLLATLRAGLPREAFQVYERGLGGFPRLGLREGGFLRGLRVASAFAQDEDPARLDPRLPADERARLVYDWGLYSGALGDLAHAERCYAAHEVLVREALERGQSHEAEEQPLLATNLRTRAYVARLRGALPLARARIDASVERARGFPGHLIRGLALAASVRHDQGEVDAAAVTFARVWELEGGPEARRALWEAEHRLALGERARAIELAGLVLHESDAARWGGHAAHARVVLGHARVEADVAQARDDLAQARAWCDRSGEVEMRLRTHALAARLALASGAPGEAAREADVGLRLAVPCGFALAAIRLQVLAAEAALALGDPARARAQARVALDQAADAACGDAWGAADAGHVAGLAAARAGDAASARDLLRAALAARERLRHPGADATRRALSAS